MDWHIDVKVRGDGETSPARWAERPTLQNRARGARKILAGRRGIHIDNFALVIDEKAHMHEVALVRALSWA